MCRVTVLLRDNIVDVIKSQLDTHNIKVEWITVDRFIVEADNLYGVEEILEELDVSYSVVQP